MAQLHQPEQQQADKHMIAASFADLFSKGLQEVADMAARACNEQNQQQRDNDNRSLSGRSPLAAASQTA